MNQKFEKYKPFIKSLWTENDINNILLKDSINNIFDLTIITKLINSNNKVEEFFTEFDKVNCESKYNDFFVLTKDMSEHINIFFGDPEKAEQAYERLQFLTKLVSVQIQDHFDGLEINEVVLTKCSEIGLISELQCDQLKADVNNKGPESAKRCFLLMINVKSEDWYGKLLYIYYHFQTGFIEKMLDLQKALETLQSDGEKKDFIYQYANSIAEENLKKFQSPTTCCETKSNNDKKLSENTLEFEKITLDYLNEFVKDPQEVVVTKNQLNMMEKLLRHQHVDHLSSLYLDDTVLFQCKSNKYINDTEFNELSITLDKRGNINAKIHFLLTLLNKGNNWYGNLLHVYDIIGSKFIPDYLHDLNKGLENLSGSERQNYIHAYANSIIDFNEKKFNNSDKIMDCEEMQNNINGAFGDLNQKSSTVSENLEMDCAEDNAKDYSFSICKSDTSLNDLFKCSSGDSFSFLTNNSITTDKSSSYNYSDEKSNTIDKTQTNNKPSTSSSNEASSINSPPVNNEKYLFEDDDDDEDNDSNAGDSLDFDKLFGKFVNKSANDLLCFYPKNQDSPKSGAMTLETRNYQNELAKKGESGKNVLICSPTGSGKTIVAVKIVQEHLSKNPSGKVAFLVHRIALVEQQYNQFKKYIGCRITRLTGSSKSSSTPLVGHLKSFDLFILTSDILRNALEEDNETKLESLNEFSLILFDECHNCDKKHPYNRIMNHYFKLKNEKKSVPQIIGLTASTGTNKAGTMDKALKRLFTLCANLDTYIVSTVKEFKEELDSIQKKPVEAIKTPNLRPNDKFDAELQKLMHLCEQMLIGMNDRGYFPKDPTTQAMFTIPEDRLHHKYLGFVGKLKTELYNMTKEEMDGRKSVFAISSYLNAFVRALMVNHLFRAQDAVKLIKDLLCLENENPLTCKVEKILKNKLKAIYSYENREDSENPSLRCLQDEITNQLEKNNQSRIIIFVRERNYTQILKSIFSSPSLPLIKCEVVVGNTISAEQGGLTQNELEEVLGRFRRGEVNVLVSTTVAEEGLDIEHCNLVIRYGHVTNETAMVQSRGRARAADSKYVVIVPYKLQWQVNKENINKYRESMMYRAIEKFQEMSEELIQEQIRECQWERELQETCAKIVRHSDNKLSTNSVWNFHCKKCSQKICKSTDIRVAETAHHIVINTECFYTMKTEMVSNNSCQIKCSKCSSLLGNRQNYKSRLFPTIKIEAFSLVCEETGSPSRSFKRWKDVPFQIAAVTSNELLRFQQQHSLSD